MNYDDRSTVAIKIAVTIEAPNDPPDQKESHVSVATALKTVVRTSLATTVAVFLGATILTTAGPAAAESRCSGTMVESLAIKKSSTVIGYLNLYWDGTYNCAETQSAGSTWGDSKKMGVIIKSCPLSNKGSYGCNSIASDSDGGTYRYYAGPVRVNGVNRCVQAHGDITLGGYVYLVSTRVGHC